MPESQISQKCQERENSIEAKNVKNVRTPRKTKTSQHYQKNYIVKNANDAKEPKKNTKNT